MKALILVDLQNDFAPGGVLAVAEGDQLAAVANRLMPRFDLVIATQDWHPADHVSFASRHPGRDCGETVSRDGLDQALWPDHCVQDTPGAKFVDDLDTEQVHHTIRKGVNREIDSYSGFFDNARRRSTGLADLLRDHDVSDVYIMGLATDYCVKFTALEAVEQGFRTHLILDGCRGVDLNEGDVEKAVEEMRRAGVQIVNSDALLNDDADANKSGD